MTNTYVYLRDESFIHDSFEWGFAQYENETDENLVTYPIPDTQWSKFRTEFSISQFQRVNYYESEEPIDESLEDFGRRIAVSDQHIPDNEKGTLQIAGAVQTDSLLYVPISRHFTVEGEDREEIVGVAVFRSESDVIAIRVNTDKRAGSVYNLLRHNLQWETEPPESQKPNFDEKFRTKFGERLAEAYTQVWFRDGTAGEVNTIHFQGSGDLRENNMVSEYFEEYDLYAGYVRIQANPDAKFYFNWHENRISFRGQTAESEIVEASDRILALLDAEMAPGTPTV
ncbi:hypothetical protein [Halorussus lipolyticus]|uniref:hypothetical protein n=1 Tax=Halorussus lipolyticus TaxID=3034024 RepID=UPI0023E7AEB1|nr:hypothetical protein [Halorussus sp. DT80]